MIPTARKTNYLPPNSRFFALKGEQADKQEEEDLAKESGVAEVADPIGPIRPGRITGLGWPAGRVRWSPICPTSPMGPMGPMGPMWSDWARRPVNFCKQTLHIPKTTAPSGRPLRSHGPAPGQAARETPGGSAESQHIHNQSSRSLLPSHPDDGENSPR